MNKENWCFLSKKISHSTASGLVKNNRRNTYLQIGINIISYIGMASFAKENFAFNASMLYVVALTNLRLNFIFCLGVTHICANSMEGKIEISEIAIVEDTFNPIKDATQNTYNRNFASLNISSHALRIP